MTGGAAVEVRVLQAIARAVEQVNRSRPPEQRLVSAPDTVLIGAGGALDSLSLVNFIVAVEEQVAEEFHLEMNLADERMRSRPENPLASIRSLAAYVTSHIQNAPHD